jgi:hypothetical protein
MRITYQPTGAIVQRASRYVLSCATGIALLGAHGALAQGSAAASCERRCLLEQLRDYAEALTDNKPAAVPVAPGVRVTANGSVVQVGGGEVWGPGRRLPYRQAFVDPSTGAGVLYAVITTDRQSATAGEPQTAEPKWWFYVVRLKVEQHRISEIEEVSYDGMALGTSPASLTLPDRIFDAVLPPEERSSRAELMRIANAYFDAVSGKVRYQQVPWHPECQRIELGTFTVNSHRSPGSCGGEFENPAVRWNVVNRRIYITDVARGLVLGIANFTTPPELPHNNGSVVFELFKVQDGLIRQIQAFFRGNGQLHSGWGSGPGS